MAIRDVGTTHDLANFLEEAARALRALPSMPLAQEETRETSEGESTELWRGGKKSDADQRHIALAETLQGLAREDARNELQSLTVDGIRGTAASLGIRVPSKSRKSDAVDLVLAQMFDVPAGQELLRTFHKRNLDNRVTPARRPQSDPGARRNDTKQ
jgi:hypothetical protein